MTDSELGAKLKAPANSPKRKMPDWKAVLTGCRLFLVAKDFIVHNNADIGYNAFRALIAYAFFSLRQESR
jgi:hypothetical protein